MGTINLATETQEEPTPCHVSSLVRNTNKMFHQTHYLLPPAKRFTTLALPAPTAFHPMNAWYPGTYTRAGPIGTLYDLPSVVHASPIEERQMGGMLDTSYDGQFVLESVREREGNYGKNW